MKKLMMAVAIVAAAVSANAAVIQWGNSANSKILGLDGETAISTANSKAWLVTAELWAVNGNGDESLVFRQASTSGSSGTSIFMNAGVMKTASQEYTYGQESSQNDTLYVLLKMTVDNKNYELKIDDQDWVNTQDSDGAGTLPLIWDTTKTYGGLAGTTTAGDYAWTLKAVPEPTSGLLLLLGVAGLALKRKRA